jgi:hypothetical protein
MSEVQPKWLEKAKETFKYHRSNLLSHEKWTSVQTAKALRRSIGSVSEDLLIARWSKTHEKELEKFKYAYEAIEWIRERQDDMEKTELN